MKKEDRLFKSNDNLIKALLRAADRFEYKKSWVQFEFVRQAYKPTLDDFISLGKHMGYKPGWANIIFEKYYNMHDSNNIE